MANQWFRMYAEFANDPKVQMLSEIEQRRFVMLLCIRCSNDNETFRDYEVAFQLRISNEEWSSTKAIFLSKKLIDQDNKILNWNKRQFVSDSSTERVRKHRDMKKQECNVSVTAPDTEQIQNRTEETLSGKPDVLLIKNNEKQKTLKAEAREVLAFLNTKTGRNYRDVDANLNMIIARLKEGASIQECRMVIAKKCREWNCDEKMVNYLRPATLFNKTKFNQYVGEISNVQPTH